MSPTEFDTMERLENICLECRQILAVNPSNLLALRRMGYAQWIIGDFDGVETTASQILSYNPSDSDWLYSRAMARLALHRPYEAESDLLRARGITTDNRMLAVLEEALTSVARVIEETLTPHVA